MKISKLWKSIALGMALGASLLAAGCASSSDSASNKSAAADAKTYVVATRGTAKPYSYTDENGKLTGYDIEVLKEIQKRNPGIKFEFKSMAIDAAFVAMDAGQVDIIANQMVHSPARDAKYIFPKESNNFSVRKLVVKAGRTDIKTLDDLKGKTVAVTTNSEFNTLVKEFNETADPKINVVYTDKGSAETLNLVATGRADAAGEYEYIVNAAKKDRQLPLESVGPVLKVIPTYFILKKDPELQKVADTIDKTLKEMKQDGTLKKLSEQYFGADYTVEPKS